MKILTLFTITIILLLGIVRASELNDDEQKLLTSAKSGDARSILKLGRIPDPSGDTVRQLTKMAEEEDNRAYGSKSGNARLALARIGIGKYFDEIELEIRNKTGFRQQDAFKKLSYIANQRSGEILKEYLFQGGANYYKNKIDGDVVLPSLPQGAAFALSKFVEGPQVNATDAVDVTREDIDAWRSLFLKNGGRIILRK